ncbi:response regulator [Aeromicrobium wangtongii]|uniref:Response regulator n=1 Tax=Aeromicrobium wangtongii TaxID=2969247 RepID=A0ABY5M4R1_9ACTN|nr:response regulator [Aeromicrobium wangtongii]MCD9199153.1 response regulator [Aeromicrobium wangtongii]UUP12817.1 response regulator [Aeromicrobium wangtongii]
MPSVLVVDDTASIRFLIRTNLQLAGFDVDEAVDGADCLQILAHRDVMPDLITVDVMMPRLDGMATVTAIRADERMRGIGIVMVTTQGHPADIQRAKQAGVDAYVTKPFDPDFLVETVSEVLERTKDRRENP